jgi:uncharacterized Zn-finger protein
MADPITPHFVNDVGSENIRIGVTKFKCMGATPPYDHPHVYLDMSAEGTVVCPYCSTLYVYDEDLAPTETDPPYCVYNPKAA